MSEDKLCQNCNHGELHHDTMEGGYYKCRLCSNLCSGKFYQQDPDE